MNDMKFSIFILIFHLCWISSNALEKIVDNELDIKVKRIIHRKYPDFLENHFGIFIDFRENFQNKRVYLYGEHLTLYDRHLRLYACEEELIFTVVADKLVTSGLKFLHLWQQEPLKLHKIQKIFQAFREGDWEIRKSKVYENNLIIYGVGENGSKSMYRIGLKEFIINIFFNPSLYYYKKAKKYEIKNQEEYREQIDFVIQGLKKYFPDVIFHSSSNVLS